MTRTIAAAIAAACLAGPMAAQAATFSFQTIGDPADPTFNQLLGINDAGVIAGYFGSTAVGHPNKGYVIAPPYTRFVPDNVQGSVQTQATGINDHNLTTGFWSDTNLGAKDNNFGFIRIKTGKPSAEFISVNDPHVAGAPLVNQLLGINNGMNAVGFYNDVNGNSHGYAYLLANNVFTPVTIPHATSVAATGINDNDLICGSYVRNGVTLGFVKPETNGAAISFRVPKMPVTQLLGINNAGQSVGFYMGADMIPHGLYYNPANGQWQTVDDPSGVNGTTVNGINNMGQLVGFYVDAANNTHGMLVTVTP